MMVGHALQQLIAETPEADRERLESALIILGEMISALPVVVPMREDEVQRLAEGARLMIQAGASGLASIGSVVAGARLETRPQRGHPLTTEGVSIRIESAQDVTRAAIELARRGYDVSVRHDDLGVPVAAVIDCDVPVGIGAVIAWSRGGGFRAFWPGRVTGF